MVSHWSLYAARLPGERGCIIISQDYYNKYQTTDIDQELKVPTAYHKHLHWLYGFTF